MMYSMSAQEALSAENARLKKELDAQKKHCETLQRRLDTANAAHALLSQQKKGNKKLEPLAKLNAKLEEWEKRGDSWKAEKEEMDVYIKDLEEERNKVIEECEQLALEHRKVSEQCKHLEAENESLLQDLTDHNLRHTTDVLAVTHLDDAERIQWQQEREGLEKKIDEAEQKYTEAIDEFLELSKKHRDKETAFAELKQEMQALRNTNESLREDCRRLEESLSAANQERHSDREEWAKEEARLRDTLGAEHDDTKAELQAARNELGEQTIRFSLVERNLKDQLEKAQGTLDKLINPETGKSRCSIAEHLQLEHERLLVTGHFEKLTQRQAELEEIVADLDAEAKALRMLGKRQRWAGLDGVARTRAPTTQHVSSFEVANALHSRDDPLMIGMEEEASPKRRDNFRLVMKKNTVRTVPPGGGSPSPPGKRRGVDEDSDAWHAQMAQTLRSPARRSAKKAKSVTPSSRR